MNVSSINEILRKYSDEKRNKSDGSSFENSIEKQKSAFKKEFNDDTDDGEGDISHDDIDISEDVIIEELVAISAADYSVKELKEVGHQFRDTILSCTWRGFDCGKG